MLRKYKSLHIVPFIVMVLCMSVIYDYQDILHKRPDAIHTWRQTDCTSLALNYHQFQLSFLEPMSHNQMGVNGKSVGEFPIIYYFVSKLYDVFGAHEYIFRFVNLAIFYIGLYYLYRLGLLFFKQKLYALLISGLMFSSPIIVYYGNNFLTDVPALAFSIIGCYYLSRHYINHKKYHFRLALLYFTLAGLLKVTALIPLCVFITVLIFEWLFIKKTNRKLLTSKAKLTYTLVPFIIFGIWLGYAHWYQKVNKNRYFSLDWDPIWLESNEQIAYIWSRLTSSWGWGSDYFSVWTIILSGVAVIVLFKKSVDIRWRIAWLSYCFGVALFVLLYFSALNHHDYYMVNLLPVVVFSIFIVLLMIDQISNSTMRLVVNCLLIIIFIQSVWHTQQRVNYRYSTDFNAEIRPFYAINEDYLNKLGITKNEKVFYDGDDMYNGVLYLINRLGWSQSYVQYDKLYSTPFYKDRGVKYVIVLGAKRANKPMYKQMQLLDIFQQKVYFFKNE